MPADSIRKAIYKMDNNTQDNLQHNLQDGAQGAAGNTDAAKGGTVQEAASQEGTSRDTAQEKTEHPEQAKPSLFKEILSWAEVFIIAIAVAVICNNFIIANSTVPTGSMEDTIEQNDRVIGSRLSYYFGSPERGDIAIFKFGWICNRCGNGMGEGTAPATCPSCGQEITRPRTLYYLKRTIGVPGDVIEIKADGAVGTDELQALPGVSGSDGAELVTAAVYVNGEKLDEPYLKEPMLYTGDMRFEVPEGCYFFLGDNRNSSLDARYWDNSYISKDKVVAKVLFRYYPNPTWLDS